MSNFGMCSVPIVEAVATIYGKWGYWNEDAAKLILLTSQWEKVAPELLAVTHMNESVFAIFPGPNTNNQPNNFDKWDVGPFQLNVGWTKADAKVKFIIEAPYSDYEVFGYTHPFFTGNPYANAAIAARRLKAMGRAKLNDKFDKLTVEQWNNLSEFEKNVRRATAYVGPAGREWREKSFREFAPKFEQFFKCYQP